VLAGSALGPFGLNLIGCLRSGLRWRPTLNFGHPDFRRYLWLSLPIMLAFSVIAVDDWVLKRIGSTLGEGVVAKITYAKTLMKVPMGVFGLAIGAAAFPTISRLVAEGRADEAYRTLIRACRAMLVMAFAAQAGLTVAGAEVAEVIFGTGRFSPADLTEIGAYTGLFCLGLWGWAAQTVIARGFYAMAETWAPSLVGSAVMIGFYPVYAALGAAYGGRGLVLASSVAISTYVVILALWLPRRMTAAPAEASGIFGVVIRMTAAVAVGIAAGEGIESLIGGWPALMRGGLAGGLAAVVSLAVAQRLGVDEVREVVDRVWGKVRRKLGR
jgi:putative peptidoglycan lipid II flippase